MKNSETLTFKQEVTVTINAATLARIFCAMADEQQAQVFIECAKIGMEWEEERLKDQRGIFIGMTGQFYRIGKHLKTCQCSNEKTRDLIENLMEGLTGKRV